MAGPTRNLGRLLAGEGALLINDTSAHTDKGYGIAVREDTVVSAWTDDEGNDLVAKFGISAVTLTTDDLALVIPGGLSNGSLTLASGSVWLLRE